MTQHEKFMREALKEARKGFREGEVPIGSVLVKNGRIVARGQNHRRAWNDPTAHAEIVCLRDYGMKDMRGAILYSTLEPCPMCAGAIVQTNIRHVVYGEKDILWGACGSKIRVLNRFVKTNRHSVLRKECRELLLQFFEKELSRKSRRWFDIELPKV